MARPVPIAALDTALAVERLRVKTAEAVEATLRARHKAALSEVSVAKIEGIEARRAVESIERAIRDLGYAVPMTVPSEPKETGRG